MSVSFAILEMPEVRYWSLGDTPEALDAFARDLPDGVNVFQALGELVRHQPQVTIVKLAGMARGGGAEFVASFALRPRS